MRLIASVPFSPSPFSDLTASVPFFRCTSEKWGRRLRIPHLSPACHRKRIAIEQDCRDVDVDVDAPSLLS